MTKDRDTSVSGGTGIWEPFLRISQSGDLQLYYNEENNGTDQNSGMRTSTDNGQTWSDASTISGADVIARDGMLGVVNTGGSNLIAVFETTEDQPNEVFVVDSVTSSDDGANWGNRQRVYTPDIIGKSAGAPQVIQVGSTTVVSFMNSENSSFQGYNGTAATILTSGDGGQSWGNKLYVFPDGANWPGMLSMGNSSFLVMASIESDPTTGSNRAEGTLEAQKVVLA